MIHAFVIVTRIIAPVAIVALMLVVCGVRLWPLGRSSHSPFRSPLLALRKRDHR